MACAIANATGDDLGVALAIRNYDKRPLRFEPLVQLLQGMDPYYYISLDLKYSSIKTCEQVKKWHLYHLSSGRYMSRQLVNNKGIRRELLPEPSQFTTLTQVMHTIWTAYHYQCCYCGAALNESNACHDMLLPFHLDHTENIGYYAKARMLEAAHAAEVIRKKTGKEIRRPEEIGSRSGWRYRGAAFTPLHGWPVPRA